MMKETLFDIFINGINPERADETDKIRKDASNVLQLSLEDLDELLAHANGTRIRRNVTEEEAKNYQQALTKVGLICLYRPAAKCEPNSNPLSIETANEISCPHCDLKISANTEGNLPEKCERCGIVIAAYLEQKADDDEREAIKAKVLAAQELANKAKIKKLQDDIEKQRKLDLEADVLRELGAGKAKNPLNVKLLAVGGGLVIATMGASYFLTQPTAPPASAVVATTPAATKTSAPATAQDAMQKTHDQAAQVLNGFGLDPDAFANAGGSGGDNSASVSTPQANPQEAFASSPMKIEPMTESELFAVLNDGTTWDYFLAQNSKALLERQLPENSVKLNKYIVANDVYIDAMGELLNTAQKTNKTKLVSDYIAIIETRLTPLSTEEKAIYFAQAGRYLALENGSNQLLAQAENLLPSLPKVESQLNVILKLAVAYSKSGNVASGGNYFNKIPDLMAAITDLDMQVQLRTAVAKAYRDVNNLPAAKQWLVSIEPLMKQIKLETLSGVIASYAACDQWQSALNMLAQVEAKDRSDAWLYQAIGATLKAGFILNAIELNKNFHSPSYRALANILIATYSNAAASELLADSEKLLDKLSPFEKTMVASQLVEYYGKIKNTAKTDAFLKISQDSLASFPISEKRDVLVDAVIEHYVHGFQIKAANKLLIAIKSTATKMRLNTEINQLTDVAGLLK